MVVAYIIGAVFLLSLIGKMYMSRNDGFWKKTGIPTIDAKYVTGLLERTFSKSAFHETDVRIYKVLKEKNLEYAGIIEMSTPTLICRDLELIKKIYVKDFEYFVNRRGFQMKKTDPHFYKMLFNQEDNQWRGLRKTLSPTFTTGKIRRMFVNYKLSSKKLVTFIEQEIKSNGNGDLDLQDAISRFTMDVIANSAFGLESKMFEDSNGLFSRMAKKFQTQLDGFGMIKLFMLLISPKFMEFFDVSIFDREADSFFTKVILGALQHRQKTGEKRDDFLQLMLETRKGVLKIDEKEIDTFEKEAMLKDDTVEQKVDLDDDMVVSQALQFLLAGYDVTETLMSFAIYALATHPEIQDKLRLEVSETFEKEGGFNYDAVNKMEYLDMFITETLRMYPPAVRTERRATKDYNIPESNYVLPKGTVVGIPVYCIHHDPEYWPEPEKFDPLRFSPENKAKLNPYAWQPFGHGPRNCIGMRFALMEAKTAVAYMVHHLEVSPCKKTLIPMKYKRAGSLKPLDGMWLNIRSIK